MILFNFVYDGMMGLLVTPMMRMMALGRMLVRDLKYVAKRSGHELMERKACGFTDREDWILLSYRYLRHELDEFNRVHGHLFALMLVPMVIGLFVLSHVMTDPAIPRYFHGFFSFVPGHAKGSATSSSHLQSFPVVIRTSGGLQYAEHLCCTVAEALCNCLYNGHWRCLPAIQRHSVSYSIIIKGLGLALTVAAIAVQAWLIRR